jgi:anti-sigma regulatory factor (Ser/Thr protein kinase)
MAAITATREDTVQPCPDPPQPAVPAGWPLRAMLDLGALPTAPGCARAWTQEILWEWRMTGLSDTAILIVSELTTNSVLASRQLDRPAIRLILVSDHHQLVIFVRDFHPGIPTPRHADEDVVDTGLCRSGLAESGHCLGQDQTGSSRRPAGCQPWLRSAWALSPSARMMAAVGADPQLRVRRKSSGRTRRRSSISCRGSHGRSSTRAQKRAW